MLMRNNAIFGPGGNSEAFYAAGFKATVDAPRYLKGLGLGAYEVEAGNGLRIGDATLTAIGDAAGAHGIELSLHSPYFISLSSVEREKREKSVTYIMDCVRACGLLRADTVVIHAGSAGKISREQAMCYAAETLEMALEAMGDAPVILGVETMGKQNQLGTLQEVITLCKMDSRLAPVVDFGHVNARECGGVFPDADAYRRVFDAVGNALGDDKARYMHCHFSKIEFTGAGEKRHLTFEDATFGPDFEPLAEALARENLCPRIICESAGTQDLDALAMHNAYRAMRNA